MTSPKLCQGVEKDKNFRNLMRLQNDDHGIFSYSFHDFIYTYTHVHVHLITVSTMSQ